MIEIEDLNKWRDILCLWIGRLNIIMSTLLNLIYKFNVILIPASYFVDIKKLILKIIWKGIFLYYWHEFVPKQNLMENLFLKWEIRFHSIISTTIFSQIYLSQTIFQASWQIKTWFCICSFIHASLYSSKIGITSYWFLQSHCLAEHLIFCRYTIDFS